MPRKLPWKTKPEDSPPNTTPKKQSPRPESSAPPLTWSRRPLEQGTPPCHPTESHHVPVGAASPAVSSRLYARISRPSAHTWGSGRFMIAGPAGDDRYRMVEDELLATAGLFTAHLHRAEYTRLKRLAAAQNAAAIREIERPVVPGPATATATRRRGLASRTARRRGLGRGDGEGPWVGSSLQGLMETPRGEDASLAGVGARLGGGGGGLGATSRPRAAVVSACPPAEVGGRRDGEASSSAGAGAGRGRVEAVQGEGEDDEDDPFGGEGEDDEDDPFGVRQRRVRREKSREQMARRTGERETQTPTKLERDMIPRFF
ncbi:hypothetical protein MAC_00668 [Metarhizium acridum CQMa 102]|uniref:Uncharacterized protein n=1 Tax=Metarhizium acridum (strain CQMa 102) TaxID=655827 RepID=E9DSS0_METAQ|nr:uncharacterized protein MAC_00668 [Metarhizium acridum CQMa 102]EFY93430.1 hypothetical protein MAC_00668 [Metarhizium acridum CQMa 102]